MSVIFTDVRPTITVELPSYPGSEVVLYKKLKVGESRDLAKKYPNASSDNLAAFDSGMEFVLRCIKSWNFVNEAGEALPINMDTLEMLTSEDFEFLASTVAGDSKKKNNQSKSMEYIIRR